MVVGSCEKQRCNRAPCSDIVDQDSPLIYVSMRLTLDTPLPIYMIHISMFRIRFLNMIQPWSSTKWSDKPTLKEPRYRTCLYNLRWWEPVSKVNAQASIVLVETECSQIMNKSTPVDFKPWNVDFKIECSGALELGYICVF